MGDTIIFKLIETFQAVHLIITDKISIISPTSSACYMFKQYYNFHQYEI